MFVQATFTAGAAVAPAGVTTKDADVVPMPTYAGRRLPAGVRPGMLIVTVTFCGTAPGDCTPDAGGTADEPPLPPQFTTASASAASARVLPSA
jgi:hypothetical protein